MNGTCGIGQLLMRGYDQEMMNGRHLRDAYVNDGLNTGNLAAEDQRMRLFDLSLDDDEEGEDDMMTMEGEKGEGRRSRRPRPYESPNLYYRVDDEERTLMSGEILIRGMFG